MEGRIKAGSFTALVFVLSTAAALIGHWFGFNTLGWFFKVSPIFLIILGLEYLFASNKDDKVQLAWGTIIPAFIICIAATIGLLGFQWFSSDAEATSLPDSEHTISTDVHELRIDNVNGSVKLLPHHEQTIKIKTDIRHPLFSIYRGDIEVETYTKGDTFHIETDAPHISFLFVHSRPFVDLTVYVPENHPLNVEVEQKNGKITAQAIHLLDTFHGKTTNGKIEVTKLHGELDLQSTNGDISVKDASGDIEAKTTNGKIEINGNIGEMEARTTNGSIHAASSTVTDDWELKTTNGKLTITIPHDASVELSARTTNGRVEAPDPFQIDGKKISGKLGSGMHEIEAKTTNGTLVVNVE